MADLGNISKIQLVNGDVAHFQDLVSGYTKNTGTITGIKMNGSSKGTSGVVDLGTVITAHQDISGKADKSATVSTVTWDSTNSKLTKTINGTTTDVVTIATIKSALALPDPMVFKGSLGTGGTITSLPTAAASNKGYTYKVITAGTYASQAAKVGDTFISDGSTWVLIPSGDEPSGTVTSVGIANGGAISISGSPITSSGTITISHADTSSQASSSNSGRTYIQSVTLDTYGHVTKLTTATETVTNTWRGIQDNLTSSTNTSESLSAKQGYLLANGSARDNTKLPLTGGTVTGAVTFGSSVSMDEATVGDLVINGAASCTNNLQVNTINGVTVGSSPKFTDTIATVSTTGSGNAVTAISASGGALTVTKGSTFLTSHQSVVNKGATLAWSTTSTIATIGSTDIKVTMPANPNTDHYAWNDITGKPSSFTPSSHTHSNIVTEGDNRSVATTPNDYANAIKFRGLKNSSTIGSPSSDTYSYLVGLRGWSDNSGGNSHEIAFNDTGIFWRSGATTSWGNWGKIYTTLNKPTASDVGLGNVENKSSATIRGELTKANVTTALGYTPPTTNTTYSAGSNITLSGTTFSLTKANVTGALGYTPPTTDTNTHRSIQMNGTEILGNNTTALNLKAGTNITLTNSSGTVTISANAVWG